MSMQAVCVGLSNKNVERISYNFKFYDAKLL